MFFPQICVLSSAQDMENMSEDDGWEFVNLGDQQSFGIKTAGLEEKATACQMLVCLNYTETSHMRTHTLMFFSS